MTKNAVVKGDILDQVGKTGLIIALAAIFFCAAALPEQDNKAAAYWLTTALISTSTVVLALVKDKVKYNLKCIPLVVFTASRLPGFFNHISFSTSSFEMLFALGKMLLLIITCIEMMTIKEKDGDGYKGWRIRYLLVLLLITESASYIPELLLYENRWTAAIVLSRASLLMACMILYLPRQGFLNIRRIIITLGVLASISLVTYGEIKLIEKWMVGIEESNAYYAGMAVLIAVLSLMLCTGSKTGPKIESDEYEYTFREKIMKNIGWSIFSEEIANRRNYIESASKRDFSDEYAHRFYNDTRHARDIEGIQQRIRDIHREIIMCSNETSELAIRKGALIEYEGMELLGKLSIAYNFDTGINSCSIETLKNSSERWE